MRNMIDLNKKGISSAVAAVLIATISITLVGTSYFFSKGVIEKGIAETFEVIDIFGNRVIVRNTGTQPINEFKTLIDGNEIENEIEDLAIQPKSLGTINISLEGISPGRHQLTLISKSMSQTWAWQFEYLVPISKDLEPSLQQASIEAIVGTEQGEAEIGKPVKWTSKISFNNPSEIDIMNYKSSVLLPEDAINIVIKDPDRQILAKNTNSWSISVTERSNMSYSIEFETPAPYKEESVLDTAGLRKRIKVNSDASLHYENVRVSTEVSENAVNQRLYLVKDDTRIDVTNNPSYNVSFVDTDSNGINDRIEWVVPELSEIIFETQGETPWLNITLLTPVPYLCNETYPCDWDQYSEQWINASVECIDGYCGEVTAYARYNNSGTSIAMISTTKDDQPFYVTYPTTGDPDNKWYNITSNDPAHVPPGRARSAMAYDSKHDRTIMFGGAEKAATYFLNDTWIFNYSDEKWYNVTKEGSPQLRQKHAIVYDSKNDRTILFGGEECTNPSSCTVTTRNSDTWIFNYSDEKWYEITPAGSPLGRMFHAMAYDSANQAVIMFGGMKSPPSPYMLSDTWLLNFTDGIGWKWYELTPSNVPPGREQHSMAYDSYNKRIIMFGGYDLNSYVYLNDTWVFNFTDGVGWNWYNVTTEGSPSQRYGHTLAYDSENRLTIMFGGTKEGNVYNDTWVFNFTDKEWYNVTTVGSPPIRYFHVMAYDSKHDRNMIYSGYTVNNINMSDTWVLNYTYGREGNPLSCGFLDIGEKCQLNWTVMVTGNADTKWRINVNFSSDQLDNVTDNATINILGPDVKEPKWVEGSNSTNDTTAGKPVMFSLNWTDDRGLSGFIFSWSNGANWTQTNETSDLETSTIQNKSGFINTTIFDDGFETDITTNWTADAVWTRDSQSHSGSQSATKAARSNPGNLDSKSRNTSLAKAIYVDFWFWDDDCDSSSPMILEYNDSTGNWVSIQNLHEWDDDQWNHYVQRVTKETNPEYFHTGFAIRFEGGVFSSKANFWVDDVKIIKEHGETEGNKTYKTYNNVLSGRLYEVITNITVTVNVSVYNNSGSSNNSNSNPDLWLEIYNGNEWIELGNMSINGTGNFSNSTQDWSILSGWQTDTNRDIRIKGKYFDTNITGNWYDEIDYEDVWLKIDSNQEFVNDTWQQFSNIPTKSDYSNVTKVVNSTEGATIKWMFYANDTSNNRNASDISSFITAVAAFVEVTSVYFNVSEFEFNDSIRCNGTISGQNDIGAVFYKVYHAGNESNPEYEEILNLNNCSGPSWQIGKECKVDIVNLQGFKGPWNCSLTANDGVNPNVTGYASVAAVMINTPPTKPNITSPQNNSLFNMYTPNPITVLCEGSTDPNPEDSVNYTIRYRNVGQGWEDPWSWNSICVNDKDGYCDWDWHSTYVSYKEVYLGCWASDETDYSSSPSSEDAIYIKLDKEVENCDLLRPDNSQILDSPYRLNGTYNDYFSITNVTYYYYNSTHNYWEKIGANTSNLDFSFLWSVNQTLEDLTNVTLRVICNDSSNNTANETEIGITVDVINQPPQIWNLKVRNATDHPINEVFPGDLVNITVNASDPDPVKNISYIEGNFTDVANGNINITNLTASEPGHNYTHNWTLFIKYSWGPGQGWVNVTVYDTENETDKTTTNITIITGVELIVYNVPINFSTKIPGPEVTAEEKQGWPLILYNKGNLPINLTQYGQEYLTGVDDPVEKIKITNITWNQTDIGDFSELTDYDKIVNTSLQPSTNQSIYYKMKIPAVKPQDYGGVLTYHGSMA